MSSRPNTRTYFSEEEESYGGGLYSRGRNPMPTRSGGSTPAREIPGVAFNLDTNVDQFRDLFFAHINEGKIGFVGINYDTSIAEVKQMLFEQPLPWPNSLVMILCPEGVEIGD